MPVTLTVEDVRDDLHGPQVSEIPDGARILVRRSDNGADVHVLPGERETKPAEPPAPAAAERPRPDLFAVSHFCVKERLGAIELAITDMDGVSISLFLTRAMVPELGRMLADGVPGGGGPAPSYDAALARRATAEAELIELDVAERRRGTLSADTPFPADRWTVVGDQSRGTVTAIARDETGREARIETAPDRARWLAEGLLGAARKVIEGSA